jgi:hypothetical protein
VTLLLRCIDLRQEAARHLDEGALVETAFHKFPAVFAFSERPEFPDVGLVRQAIRDAQALGYLNDNLELTGSGKNHLQAGSAVEMRLDPTAAFSAGSLKFADRIEKTAGYQLFTANGTLIGTKGDELFRMLRVLPTTDPQPLVNALLARRKDLLRIDKGQVADYLMKLAERYHPEVVELLNPDEATLGPREAD